MEFLYEYGLFAAKFATVSVVLIVLLLVISSIKSIARDEKSKDKVTFVDLINEAKERKEKIDAALLDFDVSLSAKENVAPAKASLMVTKLSPSCSMSNRSSIKSINMNSGFSSLRISQ